MHVQAHVDGCVRVVSTMEVQNAREHCDPGQPFESISTARMFEFMTRVTLSPFTVC